jgi:hypothetical protein
MASRLWNLLIPAALAAASLALASACDPCAKCGGKKTPTPTGTPSATTTATSTATPTATPTMAPNACLPSSSFGVLVQGTNATAYVPLGNWGSETTGVVVVPIETNSGIGTGGSPTQISTPNVVNSCSSNSATGQTICAANNTDVYLINGTTLTNTFTSGATSTQGFSGGSCETCGVVADSSTNKALLTIGLATGGPGGYQFLDLGVSPPAFETPIPAGDDTSEDVSIDPTRKLILSPNEGGNYQIVNIGGSSPVIFNNAVTGSPEFDSAAEDCTTGIALATDEETSNLFFADLTQATFTPGSPGTWSAPSQLENFPEFDGFSAGTDGIAVAPGTHLAIVTGEFGGNLEGVVELPSTSGTGTPGAVDWVAFTVPNDPSGNTWNQGFDPHTVTSYVSPNTNKALGVLGNDSNTFLAIVDLQGLLNAPRTGHVVNNPLPTGLVTFVAQ